MCGGTNVHLAEFDVGFEPQPVVSELHPVLLERRHRHFKELLEKLRCKPRTKPQRSASEHLRQGHGGRVATAMDDIIESTKGLWYRRETQGRREMRGKAHGGARGACHMESCHPFSSFFFWRTKSPPYTPHAHINKRHPILFERYTSTLWLVAMRSIILLMLFSE